MIGSLSEVVPDDEDTAVPCSSPIVYRAYAVESTGSLPVYVEVEAEDDAQAVALTRVLAAFYPIALWHGARFLGRFAPEDGGTAPRRCNSAWSSA